MKLCATRFPPYSWTLDRVASAVEYGAVKEMSSSEPLPVTSVSSLRDLSNKSLETVSPVTKACD